ncbi:hypothetical protein [Streptomyces sp. NPDC014894]|uniref:hypothetical protein n=1 Tax=unclassified Streptomyces TaxID=2593676 RepID=UPI0036FDBCD6
MTLPGFAPARPPRESAGDLLVPQLKSFCQMECRHICWTCDPYNPDDEWCGPGCEDKCEAELC